MTDQHARDEHERREDELSHFFADRPGGRDYRPPRAMRLAKIVLPVAAVAMLAVVVLWPFLSQYEDSVTLSYRTLERSGDEIRMDEPRYLGTDSRNRPFEVAASRASQQGVDAREVNLEGVRANIRLDGGDTVSVAASSGIYMRDSEQLELHRGVQLRAAGGYSFSGDYLSLNLNEGWASGGGQVSGAAPFGIFTADAFSVDLSGRSAALEGRVRVRLDPGHTAQSSKESQ
ncbi:MAG: LPS export ABC transporter periplasmic protein LptC [Sphingomonadales bacterium]